MKHSANALRVPPSSAVKCHERCSLYTHPVPPLRYTTRAHRTRTMPHAPDPVLYTDCTRAPGHAHRPPSHTRTAQLKWAHREMANARQTTSRMKGEVLYTKKSQQARARPKDNPPPQRAIPDTQNTRPPNVTNLRVYLAVLMRGAMAIG